jgi:hypothetical protein
MPGELDTDQFLHILPQAATDHRPMGLDQGVLEDTITRLNEHAYGLRNKALGNLQEQNRLLVTRRLASLDAHYGSRVDRVRGDLEQAQEERIVRMRRAELSRIQQERERLQSEIEGRLDADITTRRLAVGLLEISHAV